MSLKSKELFILIGDDCTGKTTFQKRLISKLTDKGDYARLDTNLKFNITHSDIKRKYETISFINRSYQEKDYGGSVKDYFEKFFTPADICVLSSHLVLTDVSEMIENAKSRFYNVTGVFFSNSISNNENGNREISSLNWDNRIVIDNPIVEDSDKIEFQISRAADDFLLFLINKLNRL